MVYSAAGEGKIPFIDTRDIAAVAVVTLTQPGHIGKKYVITGSEAISYRQVTEIIGAEIGRKLRYIDESVDEARARLIKAGQPAWLIESSRARAVRPRQSPVLSLISPESRRAPSLNSRTIMPLSFAVDAADSVRVSSAR